MANHRYTYHGPVTVNLPLHGITATGGDTKTVYETDLVINHPDFERVKDEDHRKERSTHTK